MTCRCGENSKELLKLLLVDRDEYYYDHGQRVITKYSGVFYCLNCGLLFEGYLEQGDSEYELFYNEYWRKQGVSKR